MWTFTLLTQLLIIGAQTKTAMSIMNCIQARDSCMNNTACHPILEVVPRVCGAEKVACSTVTITKCQAALRTLQAFPYFNPTCLCREPMSDPACNTFRDYLFDHPCSFVKEKEKDPYPVEALPTCDYALDVCKKEPKCFQLFRDFRSHCKVSDDQCKMEDGEICHDAWTKLRFSPIFGCICPNVDRKCDRIFREVNYNPCVARDPLLELNGSTSALFSLDQHRLAELSPHMSFSPATLFPPQPGTHLHNHYLAKYRHFQHQHQHQHRNNIDNDFIAPPPPHPQPPPPSSRYPLKETHIVPAAYTESHLMVEESLSTPISSIHGIPSPGSISTSHSGSITVQVISSSHAPEQEESQLETPLYGGLGSKRGFGPAPGQKGKERQTQTPSSGQKATPIATISSIRSHVGGGGSASISTRIALQNTCLSALQGCRRDSACRGLLEPVLHFCDPTRCRQETCMKGLQKFYREVESRWALDVAFCSCRETDNRHDQCRLAQQQLHPVCAQRGDLGVNPPSCHSLADSCRAENDCRYRLEEYEQACAVDSVTKKCAGRTVDCRNAIIRILGTKLRSSCACNGTDFTQLYDCLGWQRILWVNPCVVEAQRDYHRLKVTPPPASSSHHNRHPQPPGTSLPVHTSSSGGVMVGGDIFSTTMGNLPQQPPPQTQTLPRPRNGEATSSTSVSTTTINTAPAATSNKPSTTTIHTRHPNSNSHSHGMNNGNNNRHKVVVPTHEPPVASNGNKNNGPLSSSTADSRLPNIATEEATTLGTSTSTSTTTGRTEPTTTLPPARYCRLHQVKSGERKIREGQAKRLYKEDDPTCSELCMCDLGRTDAARCTVLECLPVKHCYVKTEDEYSHLQPTYIAHRGNCLCYSGHFICEKPPPDTYTLDNGVFLFLGFSSKDEQLLNPSTRLLVRDVVDALRQLITSQTQYSFFDINDPEETVGLENLINLNTTDCRLGLYKVEGENIIINATVFDEDFSETRQLSDQLFQKERKHCLPVLQILRDLVNKQHPVIHGHSLLSILKLAAVQDNTPTPEPSSASRSTQAPLACTLLPILVALFIHVAVAKIVFTLSDWTPSSPSSSSTPISNHQSTTYHPHTKDNECNFHQRPSQGGKCDSTTTDATSSSSTLGLEPRVRVLGSPDILKVTSFVSGFNLPISSSPPVFL